MKRWAVDVAGINLESDLRLEEDKMEYVPPTSKSTGRSRGDAHKHEGATSTDELGEIHVLSESELLYAFESRLRKARQPAELEEDVSSPFSGTMRSSSVRGGGREPSVNLDNSLSMSMEFMSKQKEIKVFENFMEEGKTSTTSIVIKQSNYCNIDIVSTYLKKIFSENEDLSGRFSDNPRHYKLFIADEFTGEPEMAVMLDKVAQDFSCYALQPLPLAKIYLFPQRTTLLPTTAHDINLSVTIRSSTDKNLKPIQRKCCVPADMQVESLEALLISRLPTNCIVQGSLRVKYGPLELNINEMYNFGIGCGSIQCTISEHTILSLYRFGVTEVAVNGRVVDAAESEIGNIDDDIEVELSVEDAISFQQFEVIAINRCGVRQQRSFCVDGEHIYTIQPTKNMETNTTEKSVKDVEEVKTFPEKPKYLEIIYSKASKFEPDRLSARPLTIGHC
ncbi:hypothetical protein AGDE_11117 [Angomonas deanei]|nr:hypothetical protein AGDE_11117 [Angomonas deanei]|eukprot:EPY26738.1 hypothetical protein AGDE_11117 [Angomonas deanei]